MNEVINVNPAAKPEVEAMAATLRAGGPIQSYGPWRKRYFAHPAMVEKLLREGGNPEAYSVFGNRVAQEFRQGTLQFAQPDIRDVHIDTALTMMSIAYMNRMYIADQVFPRVQVQHKSDDYFIFDKGDGTSKAWFRDEAAIRPLNSPAMRGGYDISTDNYSVKERAYETPIDDRIRQNADAAIMPDQRASRFVTDKINLSLERIVAALVTDSTKWTSKSTLSGGSQWSDYANSDPFTDAKTARLAVQGLVAMPPNTAVISYSVFQTLALHPLLLDRVKYTGTEERPAMVTPAMLAALWEVHRLMIGQALYETANEGAASVLAAVWGKYAWFGYVTDSPSLDEPSAGYTFTTGRTLDRYREDRNTADIVRGREEYDVKKTWADSAYLFSAAIA